MKIDYREPNSISELAAMFQLRYEVYKNDPELCKMIDQNKSQDISEFDSKSWHFGAFQDGKPIGYIRLATLHKTRFTKWVEEIVESTQSKLGPIQSDFPFQTYYPDESWSSKFIQDLEGKNIGEVGKLAISKEHRKGDVIMHELIKSFLGYCVDKHSIDTGFGSCTKVLERYYRKFGFYVAEGAQPFVYKDLPEAIILQFNPSINRGLKLNI